MLTIPELLKLWDYQKPLDSEQRFRRAQVGADAATQALLATQIARTFGLRRDFEQARRLLSEIPSRDTLPPEVQAWYWLEWGRSLASVAHDAKILTVTDFDEARRAYVQAIDIAESCGLDYVVVDAMHMMVVVDREPQQQFDWNTRTIARIHQSNDATVRKWLGPLHNNQGYALHLAGRHDEALAEFARSEQAYRERGDDQSVRIAHWMTAWTYRVMGRTAEALALQLQNEIDNDAAGTPDFYVYDELHTLYTGAGDGERAEHYRVQKERHQQP